MYSCIANILGCGSFNGVKETKNVLIMQIETRYTQRETWLSKLRIDMHGRSLVEIQTDRQISLSGHLEVSVWEWGCSPLTLEMTMPAALRMSTELRLWCLLMTAFRTQSSWPRRSWTAWWRQSWCPGGRTRVTEQTTLPRSDRDMIQRGTGSTRDIPTGPSTTRTILQSCCQPHSLFSLDKCRTTFKSHTTSTSAKS